jgi:hypothetical protein
LRWQFRFAPHLLQRRLQCRLQYNRRGRFRRLRAGVAAAVAVQAEVVAAERHIRSTPRPIPRRLLAASCFLV